MAAHALNPLVAATMSDEDLVDTLRDLTMFEFNEFRPAAMQIQDLIDEIPKYRAAINSTSASFWSSFDGAETYDLDLMKKKEKDPEKYADHTWQSDRIEHSRSVWQCLGVVASQSTQVFLFLHSSKPCGNCSYFKCFC